MKLPAGREAFTAAGELFTPSRPRRWIAVLWLSVGVTALAFSFLFDPSQSRLFPPCLFRVVTGLQCPGCGSTRALHHLLHGEVWTAVSMNPLLVVYAPILGYALLFITVLAVTGKELRQPCLHASWIWALLAITVVFWVARNTPWWP